MHGGFLGGVPPRGQGESFFELHLPGQRRLLRGFVYVALKRRDELAVRDERRGGEARKPQHDGT